MKVTDSIIFYSNIPDNKFDILPRFQWWRGRGKSNYFWANPTTYIYGNFEPIPIKFGLNRAYRISVYPEKFVWVLGKIFKKLYFRI